MARRARALLTLVLVAAIPVVASATPMAFTATLTIQTSESAPFVLHASGVGDSAGAGGAASIPASVFALSGQVAAGPLLSGHVTAFALGAPGGKPIVPGANGALAFDGSFGTMPLQASMYNLLGTKIPGALNLSIVGVGGTNPSAYYVLILTGSLQANPYAPGVASVGGPRFGAPGAYLLMGTGFDARTAGGAGTLQLVTPSVVSVGPFGTIGLLSTLTITFVPEPGTLALVGVGLALLTARARRA
jgi:PEP-CTERM motif